MAGVAAGPTALERHHAVFAPTLAGHHGGAPLADGVEVSVAALADALEARLDELGIERAHMAGNSLGGWLALELGRRGRALSVVALSPAGAWSRDRDLRRVVRLIRGGHAPRVSRPHAQRLLARPAPAPAVLRGMAEHGDRIPPRRRRRDDPRTSPAARLRRLHRDRRIATGRMARGPQSPPCPVRIAWSENDRTIPFKRYGRPCSTCVPGAELVTLPGVGHVPMYDDPGLVARTILECHRGPPAPPNLRDPKEPAPHDHHHRLRAGRRGRAGSWSAPGPRRARATSRCSRHGYGEHTGRYEHVAAPLCRRRRRVYAPDHLGHGRSDGERALVDDIEVAVDDLHLVAERARAEHPDLPVVLIGHSMGGLIATRYAQRHGDELAALVLSGPAIGGNPDIEALLGWTRSPRCPIDPTCSRATRTSARPTRRTSSSTTARSSARRWRRSRGGPRGRRGPDVGALPALWIHGEADPLAPVGGTARRPSASAARAQQKVYPGARHEIFNETNRDEVIGDVVAFVGRVVGLPVRCR